MQPYWAELLIGPQGGKKGSSFTSRGKGIMRDGCRDGGWEWDPLMFLIHSHSFFFSLHILFLTPFSTLSYFKFLLFVCCCCRWEKKGGQTKPSLLRSSLCINLGEFETNFHESIIFSQSDLATTDIYLLKLALLRSFHYYSVRLET